MPIQEFIARVFAAFGELLAVGTDLLGNLTDPSLSIIGRIASIISATLNAFPTNFSS